MKICICFIVLFFCISCDHNTKTDGKLYVVTTTGMITDTVKNIGGDKIQVDGLMGPGVDPHLYKVTALDAKKLSKADLIIYNGLHLEGKMTEVLENMSEKKQVYAITRSIPKEKLRTPPEFEGFHDPHIWFDVSLWKLAVIEIRDALVKNDPDNRNFYEKNAEDYLQKLQELDDWAKKQIAQIDEESRVLVTAHDAFGYFGSAYGVEVMGLQGISTASEYGVNDVEKLVDILVKRKIRAVFIESSVPKKSIQAVVEGCQVQNHKVIIGGSLFSDAMGEEGTVEGTYIGMFQHNINTIVKSLRSNPE